MQSGKEAIQIPNGSLDWELEGEGEGEGGLDQDPPSPELAVDDLDFATGPLVVDDNEIAVPSNYTLIEVDGDKNDEEGDEEPARAPSVYAMSTYPRVQPAYQSERPYTNGQDQHDAATIDSSRTLYAEDVDYQIEHGRQYCGSYFMPVDQTEQTRQYVVHQVYLKLFDLELTTVPLHNPSYILDIGTGIGEWAIGVAEKYPECEVFGTDIAPIQPTQQVPFNIEFHIENAEEEWIRPANAVDLVHLRNMAGAFSDWRFIYDQAFSCIKPGGWIEILDFDDFYAFQNFVSFYPPGSPAHILIDGIMEAAKAAGRPRGVAHLDPKLLIDVGFVDIKESIYDLGIGTRANSTYGKFWLFAVVTGFEASCLRPLTNIGWDEAYVRDLCLRVGHETKMLAEDPARAEGFVVKLRVLTGRKPVEPRQWTAQTLNENGQIDDYSGGDDSTIGSRTMKSDETVSGC